MGMMLVMFMKEKYQQMFNRLGNISMMDFIFGSPLMSGEYQSKDQPTTQFKYSPSSNPEISDKNFLKS